MRILTKLLIDAKYHRMGIIWQIVLSNLLELVIEVIIFWVLLKLDVFYKTIMVQVKYLPCYFFLMMCGVSHVFSIKKQYKQAFKTGLAHGMGGLTPWMLNIISNSSSIKSMG